MRAAFLALVVAAAAACEPAQQSTLPPGYGDQILDDGAVLAFESGHATLTRDGELQLVRMLPQVRAALARLPAGQRRLCVAGHADSVGDEALNRALSLRRAQAVAERMIDFGIPIGDLVLRGYGSSRPLIAAPRATEAHNRVVLIARGDKCKD